MVHSKTLHINKINAWADFWRYKIGVNVIPANSVNKKTWISWSNDPRGNWQTDPIPKEIHDEWKRKSDFKNGMAIICGKVLHREDRKNMYLACADLDNKMAIDSMTKDLKKLAEHTLVEAHANPNKAHVYVYTTKPMQKKSSDTTNPKMAEKIKSNELPALELKGEGQHGIMYCTPSPHADGSNYEILGTREPAIMDEIGKVVKNICDKWGLGVGDGGKVPMKMLMDPDTKIHEGHNRHEAVMRYAESILRKYPKMTTEEFEGLVSLWNNRHCVPPLPEKELETQMKCAINFIERQIKEENKLKEVEKHKFGTDEFWSMVSEYKKSFNPKNTFIKCLDCKKDIDETPINNPHDGHNVMVHG